MPNLFENIDDTLARWIDEQKVVFVATAPLAADGHVNASPKGMAGSFAVLDPTTVGYLDYFGSGAETIAHLKENGRILVMFCAFDGRPRIVRLHGHGRVIFPQDAEFVAVRSQFEKPDEHALRSIIVIDVARVSDSCGYAVPKMSFVEDRRVLEIHNAAKPPEYFERYHTGSNRVSIDGLPALGQ